MHLSTCEAAVESSSYGQILVQTWGEWSLSKGQKRSRSQQRDVQETEQKEQELLGEFQKQRMEEKYNNELKKQRQEVQVQEANDDFLYKTDKLDMLLNNHINTWTAHGLFSFVFILYIC